MSWITKERADEYFSLNATWTGFDDDKKDTVLEQSSNRLEQLVFKDEDENRVGDRYIDGKSTVKVASKDEFLLKAVNGNWTYHAALGWTRSKPNMDLAIYTPTTEDTKACVFDVPDLDGGNYSFQRGLTFNQIQSLHSFGGVFGADIALDLDRGEQGMFSSIETQQATGIVDSSGEQVFTGSVNRRLNASFTHDGVLMALNSIEGTTGLEFNGLDTVDVIDEQGNEQTNTVPAIQAGDYFNYEFNIIDGLDKTMFLSVNDILVGNPTFAVNNGGKGGNRLLYSPLSSSHINAHSYIKEFGSTINVENPTTIPIRLVGACALLALEYGKLPEGYTGDKEYLANENDYHRMQDLPINVQAAVEPFLADYRETENVINPNELGWKRMTVASSLEYE